MDKPDIRTTDSFEELKNFSPGELKAEKKRIERQLSQLNRTHYRTKERLQVRKEEEEENPLTADYTGQAWQSQWEQGLQEAKEALSETRRAQQEELREREAVINRVLARWEEGQIELPADSSADGGLTDEEERTISIGKWLLGKDAETSDFQDSIGNFKEEAAHVIGEEGDSMSPTTVYNALRATDCWHDDPKQGDSSGLEEILRRTKEYAKRHRNEPMRSQSTD